MAEPNGNPEPSIRVAHVSHFFAAGDARKQVLVDNCLALMPGETAVMTGPSGSGKTTLMTLIGGLRTLQEGSIEVLGQELRGLSQKRRCGALRKQVRAVAMNHARTNMCTFGQKEDNIVNPRPETALCAPSPTRYPCLPASC